MFDRRRLPMFFSILLSILLAAGFVPYSMGLLPMLENLYFNGWWTLPLIFTSVAKFLQDGYSRPALGLLASGLLLFANAVGKIPVGMLPESALYAALASVAGGTVIELTDRHQKKKHLALKAAAEQKKLKEAQQAAHPFDRETEQKTEPVNNSYIPRRAEPSAAGWTPQPQKQTASKGWVPPVQTAEASKTGWDPNKTYTRPQNAQMSRTQTTKPAVSGKRFSFSDLFGSVGLALFGSSKINCKGTFPISLAIFGDSKVVCSNPDITGGLVVSIFGEASLSLRDADYHVPSSVLMLSVFGDTKLEIPYISNISYTGIPIFGDCKDKRKLVNSDQMPILSVQSFSIFGGSEIL